MILFEMNMAVFSGCFVFLWPTVETWSLFFYCERKRWIFK